MLFKVQFFSLLPYASLISPLMNCPKVLWKLAVLVELIFTRLPDRIWTSTPSTFITRRHRRPLFNFRFVWYIHTFVKMRKEIGIVPTYYTTISSWFFSIIEQFPPCSQISAWLFGGKIILNIFQLGNLCFVFESNWLKLNIFSGNFSPLKIHSCCYLLGVWLLLHPLLENEAMTDAFFAQTPTNIFAFVMCLIMCQTHGRNRCADFLKPFFGDLECVYLAICC